MRIRYQIVVLGMMLLAMQQVTAQSPEGHQHHQHQPQAPKSWSSQPLLVKPAGPRSRTHKAFKAVNLNVEQMRVYPSTEPEEGDVSWEAPVEEGKAKIATRSGDQGGYHWIIANEESEKSVRIASTVTYFSNPGPAPRGMLKQDKVELEIQPVRLPREHQQYRSNEAWPFKLLYQGEPMANTAVKFESRNGSESAYTTDEAGQFKVTFPDDFPVEESQAKGNAGHRHGRRKSAFVLSANLQRENRNITSAFNYHYTPDAFADKNLPLGIGVAMLGMLVASPLLRHRKKDKKGNKGGRS
jgi:hypothetical protein